MMAGSVNKVILVGNLGKDPEIRTLNSGERVANLSLATSEQWRDKATGERKEKTEWHRVVIFNENIVKVAENYLKKGSTVYVEGSLQTRKWEDQQGQDGKPRPDVPIVVMLLGRPPAEGDKANQRPVEQPRRKVPDRHFHAANPGYSGCFSARYVS